MRIKFAVDPVVDLVRVLQFVEVGGVATCAYAPNKMEKTCISLERGTYDHCPWWDRPCLVLFEMSPPLHIASRIASGPCT